jgi:hypothetical protein
MVEVIHYYRETRLALCNVTLPPVNPRRNALLGYQGTVDLELQKQRKGPTFLTGRRQETADFTLHSKELVCPADGGRHYRITKLIAFMHVSKQKDSTDYMPGLLSEGTVGQSRQVSGSYHYRMSAPGQCLFIWV